MKMAEWHKTDMVAEKTCGCDVAVVFEACTNRCCFFLCYHFRSKSLVV